MGVAARFEPVVRHLRTVKSSGEEERELRALDALCDDAYAGGVRAARAGAIVIAGSEAAVQVAFLVALGVGGARAASGAIGVPDLIAFLLYLMLLVTPLVLVVMAVTELQGAVAADARLRPFELLPGERSAAPTTRVALAAALERSAAAPARVAITAGPLVALDRVTVRAGDRTILDDVSLALPEGGVTGIVGPSGAGKTTLLELLCAFCEPAAGSVRFAGVPLSDVSPAELRRAIGYVEQDAPVMPGTLAENLRYGAPDARPAELQRVVRELRLDGFVPALPDGLDTVVGPGGRPLSGGERQRVAIARALLRGPRLLLLDEPSSQLDAAADAALRRAVAVAARDCTVIAVAHRLATVANADRIVVLEDGRVRAIGSHAELLSRDPLYRSLAAEQGLVKAAWSVQHNFGPMF